MTHVTYRDTVSWNSVALLNVTECLFVFFFQLYVINKVYSFSFSIFMNQSPICDSGESLCHVWRDWFEVWILILLFPFCFLFVCSTPPPIFMYIFFYNSFLQSLSFAFAFLLFMSVAVPCSFTCRLKASPVCYCTCCYVACRLLSRTSMI